MAAASPLMLARERMLRKFAGGGPVTPHVPRTFNPFGGVQTRYGYGPGHLFFKDVLPEEDAAPLITADTALSPVPLSVLAGSGVGSNSNPEPASDRSGRSEPGTSLYDAAASAYEGLPETLSSAYDKASSSLANMGRSALDYLSTPEALGRIGGGILAGPGGGLIGGGIGGAVGVSQANDLIGELEKSGGRSIGNLSGLQTLGAIATGGIGFGPSAMDMAWDKIDQAYGITAGRGPDDLTKSSSMGFFSGDFFGGQPNGWNGPRSSDIYDYYNDGLAQGRGGYVGGPPPGFDPNVDFDGPVSGPSSPGPTSYDPDVDENEGSNDDEGDGEWAKGGRVRRMMAGGQAIPMGLAKTGYIETMADGGMPHRFVSGGAATRLSGGQDDDVPALLSENEYVIPADVVVDLGDGNPERGASVLEKMVAKVRSHKAVKGQPPKAKGIGSYLGMEN